MLSQSRIDKINPAWGNNPNILAAVNARPIGTNVRLLASLPNFEQAYFDMEVSKKKPYNAIITLKEDANKFAIVKMLLDALLFHDNPLPENCMEWKDLAELKLKFEA